MVHPSPRTSPGKWRNIESAARTALEGVASRARRSGREVDTLLRHGVAWVAINVAIEETKADLVVMGTHGRRGLVRALLGSVAGRKIVRTAACPVLTVHGTGEH